MRWALLGLAVVGVASVVGLAAGQGAAVVLLLLAWATALVTLRALLARPAPVDRHAWWPSRRPKPTEDPAVASMTRRLFWGGESPRMFDLHLRPVLARAASSLLADRRGLDLERDRSEVSALLGADAFDLIDPHRPPSADDQPAPTMDRLDQLLDRLETL
jgi:hypothetical protein